VNYILYKENLQEKNKFLLVGLTLKLFWRHFGDNPKCFMLF